MEARETWYTGNEVEIKEVGIPMSEPVADNSKVEQTVVAPEKPKSGLRWLNLILTVIIFGGIGYGLGYVHGRIIDRPRLIEDIRDEFSRYGVSEGGNKSIDVRQVNSDGHVHHTSLIFSDEAPKSVATAE